jgi:IS4 transposase
MNSGQTLFSQLIDHLPIHEFRKCVQRYDGNRRARSFSCWDQFLCMAFAQLTFRESLRDIVTCLRSLGSRIYHAGIRGHVSRSTLADANESRDWRIYADFATALIRTARKLYSQDGFGVALDQTAYAFDSTTVDLCLTLFPWAQFRRRKSAVQLHTLIDLRGNIPCFVHVSSGRVADVTVLDRLPIEPGAFYVMDRGYTDFRRLHAFTEGRAFFIIRAKRDLDFVRRTHRPVDRSTGLRSDQAIVLCGPKTAGFYPEPLRRIRYYAADLERRFVFLTNNFTLPALVVTQLYKSRWQVELFFKWIQRYLRIKAFYGTSANAVKTQVWIAVCVYVAVAIVKKRLGTSRSLAEILQILSIGLFEKTPIVQAFSPKTDAIDPSVSHNQLSLFEF